ncbi:MAG: GGDEF domain-containing protein [Clostridia bacterium]|nr:GGDEF domain-containing protein [Clostridia bacterium]
MKMLSEFLHQKVPEAGRSMPAYYRKALLISEILCAAFFLAGAVLLVLTIGQWEWIPVLTLAAMILCLARIDKLGARGSLFCFSAVIVVWLTWFVHTFGWSAGSPNILVSVLSLAYFNIYVSPKGKLGFSLGLIAFRVALYAYSLNHPSVTVLTHSASICFQILNSVVPLMLLSIHYILFSSSIQASERRLTLHNQELSKEAETDPLTGLLNRRALLDVVDHYRKEQPDAQFGIAIADIDFFKRVNDTYGHNCGDYTLKELSKLFLSKAESRYTVCRWGGEEFCFFMPGQNLDEAGIIMHDIHMAVGKMALHFNDIDFKITITIGVEENDYKSTMEQLFDRADRKLYMGKANGRDQVVI